MRTLVTGGTIINEGRQFAGNIVIEGTRIAEITEAGVSPLGGFDAAIDASGCCVLPGVIDSHVHFREPGLTHKGDISSESRAALCGGVTSFFDMPNTIPQTIDSRALENKFAAAGERSRINYSFFPGATPDNTAFLLSLDGRRVPGIKLFMGSSTGNMQVEDGESLERIFRAASEKRLVLMAHCEDNGIICRNMRHYKELLATDDPDVRYHSAIRNEEACYASSSLGAALAKRCGTRFHIAHISTARELELLGGNITGEICVSYLLFDEDDYSRLGSLVKCNPAIKSRNDRKALVNAVKTERITTVSTDHAPHLEEEKQGGAARAMSGIASIQFSLPLMLTLADENDIPLATVVKLMCHNPARLFSVEERGFLRAGYKADITIVRRKPFTINRDCIQGKCRRSAFEGMKSGWTVEKTICNGHLIYNKGVADEDYRGEEITFCRR